MSIFWSRISWLFFRKDKVWFGMVLLLVVGRLFFDCGCFFLFGGLWFCWFCFGSCAVCVVVVWVIGVKLWNFV